MGLLQVDGQSHGKASVSTYPMRTGVAHSPTNQPSCTRTAHGQRAPSNTHPHTRPPCIVASYAERFFHEQTASLHAISRRVSDHESRDAQHGERAGRRVDETSKERQPLAATMAGKLAQPIGPTLVASPHTECTGSPSRVPRTARASSWPARAQLRPASRPRAGCRPSGGGLAQVRER